MSQFVGSLRLIPESHATSHPTNRESFHERTDLDSSAPSSPAISEASDSFATEINSGKEFFVDTRHMGNETSFINDGGRNSNALYLQVFVNGWSAIFCVTCTEISNYGQILADYGQGEVQGTFKLTQAAMRVSNAQRPALREAALQRMLPPGHR